MTKWKRACLIAHRLWLTLFAMSIAAIFGAAIISTLKYREERTAAVRPKFNPETYATEARPKLGKPIQLTTAEQAAVKAALAAPGIDPYADIATLSPPSAVTWNWGPVAALTAVAVGLLAFRIWIEWLLKPPGHDREQ